MFLNRQHICNVFVRSLCLTPLSICLFLTCKTNGKKIKSAFNLIRNGGAYCIYFALCLYSFLILKISFEPEKLGGEGARPTQRQLRINAKFILGGIRVISTHLIHHSRGLTSSMYAAVRWESHGLSDIQIKQGICCVISILRNT